MTDAMVGALSALGGALVGGSFATFGSWLAARAESRRHERQLDAERQRHETALGVELGKMEWTRHADDQTGALPPPVVYATFNVRMFREALAGKLTPERYKEIQGELHALLAALPRR
jgi:hypothetical protein